MRNAPGGIAVGGLLALLASAGPLAGCAPYVMSYVHLEAADVTYQLYPCSRGAPVGARYERNGVRFEVTLEPHGMSPLKDAYLKVRAPRDVAISIPDPVARVTFRSGEGSSISVRLVHAPLDWQGPYVDQFRSASPLAEYRFVFVDLPRIDSSGTLELPLVYADGVPLRSPAFTFEKRPYAGIAPLNC